MVRKQLHMPLFAGIDELASLFGEAGFKLYVVGGAVRDCVLGLAPKDYDLATDATPDQVIGVLEASHGWRCDLTGKSFGVVRAKAAREGDLHEYEIATFRTDVGEGRRPEAVVFTTIEEDVKRRDLTINALFYDLHTGEVVDMVGGLADIEASSIRTVGRPEDRFREDRLRVLRALRFAARFGWTLDEGTATAIIRDNNLDGVSPERTRDEFVKGLAGAKKVRSFLGDLEGFDMWKRLFPGLTVQRVPDVMVSSSGPESRSVPVVLAVLLDGNDPGKVAKTLASLKYTAHEVAQVRFLMDFRDVSVAGAFRCRRRFNTLNVSDELLTEYCAERGLPVTGMLRAFLAYQLTVSGDDLLSEGLSGAALGHELERRETVLFRQLHDAT